MHMRVKKEDKFNKKTYSLIYPSNCIPPGLYGTLKAHKPEKNYPMRAVVSTIGSPPYGTSKYLVKIIQHAINKNKQNFKFIVICGRSKGMEYIFQ